MCIRDALVPARGGPHLEVEVAGGGAAGRADPADHLAGTDRVTDPEPHRTQQVHVGEVVSACLARDHYVVAGCAGEIALVDDLAAAGGDHGRAAGGHQVLTLVAVSYTHLTLPTILR